MDTEKIIQFWFGDLDNDGKEAEGKSKLWFTKSDALDISIKENFKDLIFEAPETYQRWLREPKDYVALVILLDQFSRNAFRNTPQAFSQDDLALSISKEALKKSWVEELPLNYYYFLIMPFMHSESREIQEESLSLFKGLAEKAKGTDLEERFQNVLDYAIRHKQIIDRFGRYPHRNVILGRESTEEEKEFLKSKGSSF